MSNSDFIIKSTEGETLAVSDMGEGLIVLSSRADGAKYDERICVKLEQLEEAVERLRDRYAYGAFG